MRNHALLLIVLVTGCSSHPNRESNPVSVTLTAPIDVTGTWSVIDTSRMLSCTYDLTANASGGMGDEDIEWADATISLFAPPALEGRQPHPATRVAEWFGAPTIKTGSTRTARINVGRERPFSAEHEIRYRTSRGLSSTGAAIVHCRAPA